ncbi:hypothetical protein D3C73_1479920 [compost metagenome]
MAEQHDAASALLFGVGQCSIDACEDPLGIGFGLFVAGFGNRLVNHIGFTAGRLLDGGGSGRVLAADIRRFHRGRDFDNPGRNDIALLIGQGDTQAAPLRVR